jgi:hypothetical protein
MRPLRLVAPAFALAVAAASSCSSGETTGSTSSSGTGGMPIKVPDPVVNEQTSHASPVTDAPYAADDAITQFRTAKDIPDLDVRALAVLNGDVYAGTASGLARWHMGDAAFSAVAVGGKGAIVDLSVLGGNQLVLGRADGVEVLTAAGGAGTVWPLAMGTIAAVATYGGSVYIGTDHGLSKLDAGGETQIASAQGFAVRDLAVSGDVIWMATAMGVRRYDAKNDKLLMDLTAPAALVDDDVRALALTSDAKQVLAATAGGLAKIDATSGAATLVLPGKDGLPNGDLHAVAELSGEVLTGHGIGATAMTSAHKDHYHSLRFIPDEAVTAVALGAGNSRWIATKKGVSRIDVEQQTLSAKAALLEKQNPRFWRMDGFVSSDINFADPYDMTADPQRSDEDNDGLWTEVQVAAWCLAYAETKDEAYYQSARKAMDTMFLLFDVPGDSFEAKGMKRGFISRSLVRDDEAALFADKAAKSNWHQQKHGSHTYYWKDDTSSDEYAGHFFGIPLFYDLCAKSEAEKKDIRDRVASSMTYVIDGGDKLIDLDGQPTTFGRWDNLAVAVDGDLGACLASGKENCASSYGGGGWLNSIEILGHLLAAWHITGDAKYYDEYERLAITERYGDMVPLTDHTLTVTSRHAANHSDHELASLSYFTLLRYEPNADRRAKWQKSLLDFYGYEKEERNALELGVIASAVADGDFAAGAGTLREFPLDFRQWKYDNAHRKDVTVDADKDRFDSPQFTTVLPYDEIRIAKWNSNPYEVQGGGNGKSVQAPWPYLLPYWMFRHFKALK